VKIRINIIFILVSRVWQSLVQDDDVRITCGKAHENARSIVEDHDGLSKVTAAMKGKITNGMYIAFVMF
jgi:hypothetical protein